MIYLKNVATDAEVVAQDYDVLYYSEESDKVYIKGATPSIEL